MILDKSSRLRLAALDCTRGWCTGRQCDLRKKRQVVIINIEASELTLFITRTTCCHIVEVKNKSDKAIVVIITLS